MTDIAIGVDPAGEHEQHARVDDLLTALIYTGMAHQEPVRLAPHALARALAMTHGDETPAATDGPLATALRLRIVSTPADGTRAPEAERGLRRLLIRGEVLVSAQGELSLSRAAWAASARQWLAIAPSDRRRLTECAGLWLRLGRLAESALVVR